MTADRARERTTGRHLRPVPAAAEPPAAIEAEEAVLGALLVGRRWLPEVAEALDADDFYRPAHRRIFTALADLATTGVQPDPVVLAGELRRRGELDDLGGALVIHHLMEATPTGDPATAVHYAAEVAETARARRRIDLGTRITHLGYRPDSDPAEAAALAAELAATATATPGRWEPPTPLSQPVDLPPFPVGALPGWVGEFVAAQAEATQTPPDLAGMLSLATLATVAAGAAEIRLKPDWVEPLNLFVAVALPPGSRKSAVVGALTRPLAAFETAQQTQARARIGELATRKRVADAAAAAAEKAAGALDADDAARAEAIRRVAAASAITVPPLPRWLVDEATPEALTSLLAAHGRIALLSPEGDVFEMMAGRYQTSSAAGPNLGVYLKGHAGDRIMVDRKGRDPEVLDRPALTIGISPQPEVLADLARRPGFRGRGLLARFLYSLPPSLLGHRQLDPPPVPAEVADGYAAELRALAASLPAPNTPARPPGSGPALLTIDPDAAAVLHTFRAAHEPRLDPDTGDLGHLFDWAAKLPGALCRIAGLWHLAAHLHTGFLRPVSAATMAAAVGLADYLTAHAAAVFDLMGADPATQGARHLLDWITRTGTSRFTRRDAHRALPTRFRAAADLDAPLRMLVDHGYLTPTDPRPSGSGSGGRPPAPAFLVNPLGVRQIRHIRQNPAQTHEPAGHSAAAPAVPSLTKPDSRLTKPLGSGVAGGCVEPVSGSVKSPTGPLASPPPAPTPGFVSYVESVEPSGTPEVGQ